MGAVASAERGPWASEGRDAVRAVSGGILFGIPLLYTQEVWLVGGATRPRGAAIVLGLSAVVVFVLNRTAGFRSTKDVRAVDAFWDTVEALAVGVVVVTVVLVLLREITGDTPTGVGLGKVLYQALPFCLGVGLARHFFHDDSAGGGGDTSSADGDGGTTASDGDGDGMGPTVADLGVTFLGAVFIALNIAPTEEISALSATMGPQWLLALVVASLVVSYAIVFVAGFSGEERRRAQGGVLQHPVAETLFCYLVALGAAALMLLLFRKLEGPWDLALGNVVVLGLPAAVGGAAGRLAL